MINSYILLSSSPPRKQVHSLPNGFVGNGDVGAHSGFVGVSGDLLDDSGGNAEFEGNAYEGTAGSVGSEELPFRVHFIVSYTSPIITILYRCIETTYFAEIFEIFVHLLVGYDRQGKIAGISLILIFLENCSRIGIERDFKGTICLFCNDIYKVADNIRSISL